MIELSSKNPIPSMGLEGKSPRTFRELNLPKKIFIGFMYAVNITLILLPLIFMFMDKSAFKCFELKARLNASWMEYMSTNSLEIDKLVEDINIWNPDKQITDEIKTDLMLKIQQSIDYMKLVFPNGFNLSSYNEFFLRSDWVSKGNDVYKGFSEVIKIIDPYTLKSGNTWLDNFSLLINDVNGAVFLFRPMVLDTMLNLVCGFAFLTFLFLSIKSYIKDPETFGIIANPSDTVRNKQKFIGPLPDKVRRFNRHGYWIINFGIAFLSLLFVIGSHYTIIWIYTPLIIGNIGITIPCLLNIIFALIYSIGYFSYTYWVAKHQGETINVNQDITSNEQNTI